VLKANVYEGCRTLSEQVNMDLYKKIFFEKCGWGREGVCIVLKCWVLLKEEIVNPSFHWIPKIARYDVTELRDLVAWNYR
jgi:hypothetical protein